MKGINEWLKKLERMEKEFPETVEMALNDEANLIIGEVRKEKYKNPTGTLKNAWGKETTGPLQRTIFNNTEYVNHVEYGHRIVRNGKTVGFVRGKYTLYKAMKKSNKRFPKALNTLIKNLFK